MDSKSFQTLNEIFLQAVENNSRKDLFLSKSEGQYRGISAREVSSTVSALARAFNAMGVYAGSRVALLAENRIEWALTDYAILGLGAATVPLYSTLLEDDVEYILRDSGAQGVVVSTPQQLQKVLNVRSRLPELSFILAMDAPADAGLGVENWREVTDREGSFPPDPFDWFRARAQSARSLDLATIVYTSGTTGVFKGVPLTHGNIVSNVNACASLFDHGPRDVAMSFLPLAHIFERMIDFHYLARGVSIAYAENLDALPRNLLEARPTLMAVVPRLLQKIREKVLEEVQRLAPSKQKLFGWAIETGKRYFRPRIEGRQPGLLLRLKRLAAHRLVLRKIQRQLGGRFRMFISGAAPLGRELAEFYFAIGIPVYEGYGLTETSPVIAVNSPQAARLGTVGRVIAGVELKLGEEIEDSEGRTGREILVRGPNVMQGYYHQDEQNGEVFRDGWFLTGDLGRLDSEGYLSITGRKKNLFKTSGGKYVSPEKLEHLFESHRYVAQLVVLGDARKFVGALVVPKFKALEAYARGQGIEFASRAELASNPQIRAFLQQQVDDACQHLPPYERIRQIVLLDKEFTLSSGELSATLKVKRPVVEERYREQIEEMFTRRAPAATSQPATK